MKTERQASAVADSTYCDGKAVLAALGRSRRPGHPRPNSFRPAHRCSEYARRVVLVCGSVFLLGPTVVSAQTREAGPADRSVPGTVTVAPIALPARDDLTPRVNSIAKLGSMAIRAEAVGPLVRDNLVDAVRRQLFLSFSVAKERLRTSEACRRLFVDLGADGLEVLGRARYGQGGFDVERGRCPGGAAAITAVRSVQVRLCPGFGVLKTTDAAVILLHEALHSAGMNEKPPDASALTAQEINRLVKTSCGL